MTSKGGGIKKSDKTGGEGRSKSVEEISADLNIELPRVSRQLVGRMITLSPVESSKLEGSWKYLDHRIHVQSRTLGGSSSEPLT